MLCYTGILYDVPKYRKNTLKFLIFNFSSSHVLFGVENNKYNVLWFNDLKQKQTFHYAKTELYMIMNW